MLELLRGVELPYGRELALHLIFTADGLVFVHNIGDETQYNPPDAVAEEDDHVHEVVYHDLRQHNEPQQEQ